MKYHILEVNRKYIIAREGIYSTGEPCFYLLFHFGQHETKISAQDTLTALLNEIVLSR